MNEKAMLREKSVDGWIRCHELPAILGCSLSSIRRQARKLDWESRLVWQEYRGRMRALLMVRTRSVYLWWLRRNREDWCSKAAIQRILDRLGSVHGTDCLARLPEDDAIWESRWNRHAWRIHNESGGRDGWPYPQYHKRPISNQVEVAA